MPDEVLDDATKEAPRSRGRIVAFGAVALAALYVAGAVVNVPRIERDLQRDVQRRLAVAGIAADVELSGQDATLRCGSPLPDPDAAARSARAVSGVHDVTVDSSCRAADAIVTSTTASSSVSSPPATSAVTLPPATTVQPSTTVVVTTEAPPPTAISAPPWSALLSDGRLTLSGTVASEAQHQTVVAAAAVRVLPANIDDRLAVDPSSALTDDTVNALASVVAVMTSYLVSGDVGWDGTASRATGVYTNGLAQAAFQIAADAVSVTTVLNERPAASPQDASDIEAALNSLVSAEPILFKPGTADISPESQTTLQKVAGVAKRFGGLRIEAQGHTDSLGTTAVNQELSERRARAVVAALESYGVPAGDLASIGFGETQLVVDANGKEIPEQSRRVVFGVTTV